MHVTLTRPAAIAGTLAPGLVVLVLVAGCGGGSGGSGSDQPKAATASLSSDTPIGPFRSMSLVAKITPKKAGTAAKPQGVRLDLDLRLGQPPDADPSLLSTADVLFPQGSRYDGGAFPLCDERTLDAHGPEGCDPASIMGHGMADVSADTANEKAEVTVVNGGKDRLYFWTDLDHPVRVQAAVVGDVTPMGAPWGYKLHLTFPQKLQQVAGVPIGIHRLTISAGKGTWLSTTSCPDGGWSFQGRAAFEGGGTLTRSSKISCDG